MSQQLRGWVRVCAAMIVLAGLLLAPPGPVWACSCVMPPAPAVAAAEAAAVFSGTVTSIANRGGIDFIDRILSALGQSTRPSFGDARRVTLSVAASWKGVTQTPVTVGTGQGDADCGFNFNVGGQYLVYAYDNQGGLSTNICLRTAELTQAQADLAHLQTLPTLSVTPAPPTVPILCLGSGVLLLLAAAVAGWVWLRRARRSLPA